MEECEALMVLSGTADLGPVKIQQLLLQHGSAVEVLKAEGIWINHSYWKEHFRLVEQLDIDVIPFTGPRYPKRLLELSDHPIILYVKGSLKPCDQQSIAVVGTREPSDYGKKMAKTISKDLAANGFTVISGLAHGIDTEAHKGALQKGRTIAVMGSGLAQIYPIENKQLADIIAEKGAVISEFPMLATPDRQHFPRRNRIVSGMSLGVFLVEAPQKSGAMITMKNAFSQGKTLFALPGPVDYDSFKGNHMLIKGGKALLVENGEDIVGRFDNFLHFIDNQYIKEVR